jgi:uncharacterized RDD family membrane protein YckC
MGVVYEGEHLPTGRRVAVKLIDVEASPDALERFRQEGKLASAVSHPRCVFVFAADQDAGRPFIVLELMPGRTLNDEVKQRGPLPLGEAIGHVLDVIDGLQQVHALGVIHRDVKPSNCFLDHEGRVKVGDFGLARSLHPDVKLTRTGTFVGTPQYASPEQIKGQPLDVRADVYSVCATLYFLLTGRAPHDGGDRDPLALLARVVSEDAASLRSIRADLPAGLERILARGLARDRERRQPDLAALRDDLAAFRQDAPGLRLAATRLVAWAFDYCVMHWLLALWMWLATGRELGALPDLPTSLFRALAFLLYFALPESLSGYTLGKRLFGLRVRLRGDVAPPGLGHGLTRAGLYYLVALFPALVVVALVPPTQDYVFLSSLLQGLSQFVGTVVLLCSMRKSNGYSCLHDLLSGTRVVAAPPSERAARYPSRSLPGKVEPKAEGERIGPYLIQGEVGRHGERLLLASDPNLDRGTWLWLRPADRPAVPQARRDAQHGSRPRWLAHGEHDGQRWDAFMVPAGQPLTDAVAAVGPRTWEQARPILLELSEELLRAEAAGQRYGLDQLWLSPDGLVVLIDVPLNDAAAPAPAELLAQAAVVLLEGKARSPKQRPPRAILPTHARRALLGLPGFGGSLDVKAFHERLTATKDKPGRVSRLGRLLHLGLLVLAQALYLGVPFVLPFHVGLLVTRDLDWNLRYSKHTIATHDADRAALAAAVAAPQANPLARLLPAVTFHDYSVFVSDSGVERLRQTVDQLDQLREARFTRLPVASQQALAWATSIMPPPAPNHPTTLRPWLERWEFQNRLMTLQFSNEVAGLDDQPRSGLAPFWRYWFVLLPVPPLIGVLAALITRRGVRSMILGMDLVRRDGAPAGRLRCAWRALVAWVPILATLVLARWLEESYWERWMPEGGQAWMLWLADACWVGFALALLTPVVLALWTPARSLHDRLSGTWLVPR